MAQFFRTLNLNKTILNVALAAVLGLVTAAAPAPAFANPGLCLNNFQVRAAPAKVRTYEASGNTSQYIRDNAPDFWRWSKTNGKRYFGNLLDHQGLVIGDAHPGNFIYSPLNGRMRLFIMDIKDAGHAPFITDLAHQIMATNVVFQRAGKEDIDRSTERQVEAYLTGLRGGRFETHERLDWIFETNRTDFESDVAEYVESKTRGTGFKFKEGKIEPIADHVTDARKLERLKRDMEQSVKTHIRGATVLDFAFRPRERGGSKNLVRYWALVEIRGERQILEFKEIDSPAVEQFGPQLPHIERFNLVMETFWGKKDRFYQAVTLDGKAFWMRPKKVDVFSVPYKQKDKDERKFLRHLAAYEAYLMGQYHGKQTPNRRYYNELNSRKEEIIENNNKMAEAYVERLEERVEALQEREEYD